MMIKIAHSSLATRYLGLRPEDRASVLMSSDGYSAMLLPSYDIVKATKDGGKLDGTLIPSGTLVYLKPLTPFSVWNSMCLADVHPTLLARGDVCLFPHVLNSGEGLDFAVTFRPRVQLDIAELPWLVKCSFIQ